ncbi:gonadal somatic cell derived factor [Scophthalmus maximus]|uniref:gonadal somatic cell derived factor n=1 Tax=Scophthalmus maximus TaxID=52904 RepID=UPI001FA8D1CE|nr:gonadal somatic cell derived factor [Scophthalmus maximus]
MSCAFTVTIMLLGSSVVVAFVLQPSNEEPAASATSPQRCHGESLQSIRKSLLSALNLRAEPRLPAGELDAVRGLWQSTFSVISQTDKDSAAVPVSPEDGNRTSLKCCSLASEIFMKDLGWNNWMIHPSSLTVVQCGLCDPETNAVQCPPSHTNVQDADSQLHVPCCQPNSQEMVPVVYVDESGTVVISSMQLTRGCGCGAGNIQQPSKE